MYSWNGKYLHILDACLLLGWIFMSTCHNSERAVSGIVQGIFSDLCPFRSAVESTWLALPGGWLQRSSQRENRVDQPLRSQTSGKNYSLHQHLCLCHFQKGKKCLRSDEVHMLHIHVFLFWRSFWNSLMHFQTRIDPAVESRIVGTFIIATNTLVPCGIQWHIFSFLSNGPPLYCALSLEWQ